MTSAGPSEPCYTTAGLARAWAEAVSSTMPMEEPEHFLAGLINRLIAAVVAAPVDEQAAFEIAAGLVAHNLSDSQASCTCPPAAFLPRS